MRFWESVLRLACMCALAAWRVRSVRGVRAGPQYPATRGEVWPLPQLRDYHDNYYTFDPSTFKVEVTGYSCSILTKAIHRYTYLVKQLHTLARRVRRGGRAARGRSARAGRAGRAGRGGQSAPPPPPQYRGALTDLRVELSQPCQATPFLGMDEAYNVTVGSSTAAVAAASVWGALRGLETFAQLFYLADDDALYTEVRINATGIRDWPRHAHRGLLLDSSRHFLPPDVLRTALDAMAADKMNVLHWHLTDDQSFPYQSDVYPELSEKGAYHPSMVYTAADIQAVLEYATERGVRVVPEFDVPGHTRSWGVSHPELLAECGAAGAELGPLHPLRNSTYALLGALLREARGRFRDAYMHLGGDEVDLACWRANPELARWLADHNTSDVRRLHALFMTNTLALLPNATQPIVWQEVFDEGVPLPSDSFVHVWTGGTATMVDVINAGHRVLYSTAWYLDHLKDTFDTFLNVDPRRDVAAVLGERLAERVVGGEAAMWAEMVDERNVLTRIWPRASAVAERLWSAREHPGSRGHTRRRAEEHACRLARRRVPAAPPNGPGYCLL